MRVDAFQAYQQINHYPYVTKYEHFSRKAIAKINGNPMMITRYIWTILDYKVNDICH